MSQKIIINIVLSTSLKNFHELYWYWTSKMIRCSLVIFSENETIKLCTFLISRGGIIISREYMGIDDSSSLNKCMVRIQLRPNFRIWSILWHLLQKFVLCATQIWYHYWLETCKINWNIIWTIFLTDILTVLPSTSSVAEISIYEYRKTIREDLFILS